MNRVAANEVHIIMRATKGVRLRVREEGKEGQVVGIVVAHAGVVIYGEPFKDGCTNDECCVGDARFSGRNNGTVGINSNMCCVTPRAAPVEPARVCGASSARMTPCTRASCDGASSQFPLGPGARGGIDAPRPSQMHRRSLPGIIWHSRPVSTCRTSMNRESKMRMYGGCHATCSAVPSHSMVPFVRLGSPCRFTYKPNSARKHEHTEVEKVHEHALTIVAK
jgi:hypothetical protein